MFGYTKLNQFVLYNKEFVDRYNRKMIKSKVILRILIPIQLILVSCDPFFHLYVENLTDSKIHVIVSPPIEFSPETYDTDIDTNLNRAIYKIDAKGQGNDQIPIVFGKGWFNSKNMDYMIYGIDYLEIRSQSDTLIAQNKEQLKNLFWSEDRKKYMKKMQIK